MSFGPPPRSHTRTNARTRALALALSLPSSSRYLLRHTRTHRHGRHTHSSAVRSCFFSFIFDRRPSGSLRIISPFLFSFLSISTTVRVFIAYRVGYVVVSPCEFVLSPPCGAEHSWAFGRRLGVVIEQQRRVAFSFTLRFGRIELCTSAGYTTVVLSPFRPISLAPCVRVFMRLSCADRAFLFNSVRLFFFFFLLSSVELFGRNNYCSIKFTLSTGLPTLMQYTNIFVGRSQDVTSPK